MKEINHETYQRLYQGVLDYLVKNLDPSRFNLSWRKCFEGLIPKPSNPPDKNRYSCVRNHSRRHVESSDHQSAILEVIAYRYSRESDIKIWYKPKRSIEVLHGGMYLVKKEKNS